LPLREDLRESLVEVEEKVLRGGLEMEDLVVVVAMVREVTALVADELLVHHAVGHESLQVVGA